MSNEKESLAFLTNLYGYENGRCYYSQEEIDRMKHNEAERSRAEENAMRRRNRMPGAFNRGGLDEQLAVLAHEIISRRFDIRGGVPEDFEPRIHSCMNTMPFGTPTDKFYPLLFATCFGRESLKKRLWQIIDHAKRSEAAGCTTEKILLLTSKWDEAALKTCRRKVDELLARGIQINVILTLPGTVADIPVF